MKNWVIITLILIFLFVVIPVIIYGISVNAATKIISSNPSLIENNKPNQ